MILRTLCLILFLTAPLLADTAAAPRWNGLTTEQKEYLLEAFRLDAGQQTLFHEKVPVEVKQAALDALWGVLTPERRVQVLLYAHIERPFDETAEAATANPAPAWESLSEVQQRRALEAFRLDATQQMVWNALTPDLRQATFSLLWSYVDPADRQQIVAP